MSYATIAPILRGALKIGDVGPVVRAADPQISTDSDGRRTARLNLADCSDDAAMAARARDFFGAVRRGESPAPSIIYAGEFGSFRVEYPQERRGRSAGAALDRSTGAP